jgi:hypothetical protein
MPNGEQEKQVNRGKRSNKEKQITRRDVLRTLGTTAALVPIASLLWQGGVAAPQAGEVDKSQLSKVVDRVLTDPQFRKSIKTSPIETLERMGIKLPPETAKVLREVMKQDPDALRKAVLGEASPLIGYYNPDQSYLDIVIVIIIAVVAFVTPGFDQ